MGKNEALDLLERVKRLGVAYAVTGSAVDEYTRRSVELVCRCGLIDLGDLDDKFADPWRACYSLLWAPPGVDAVCRVDRWTHAVASE